MGVAGLREKTAGVILKRNRTEEKRSIYLLSEAQDESLLQQLLLWHWAFSILSSHTMGWQVVNRSNAYK